MNLGYPVIHVTESEMTLDDTKILLTMTQERMLLQGASFYTDNKYSDLWQSLQSQVWQIPLFIETSDAQILRYFQFNSFFFVSFFLYCVMITTA